MCTYDIYFLFMFEIIIMYKIFINIMSVLKILFFSSLTWVRINVIIYDIAFRKQFTLEALLVVKDHILCERFLRNVCSQELFSIDPYFWEFVCVYDGKILFQQQKEYIF